MVSMGGYDVCGLSSSLKLPGRRPFFVRGASSSQCAEEFPPRQDSDDVIERSDFRDSKSLIDDRLGCEFVGWRCEGSFVVVWRASGESGCRCRQCASDALYGVPGFIARARVGTKICPTLVACKIYNFQLRLPNATT